MDIIEKAVLFGGYASVSAIKINGILNKAIELQGLSNTAAVALGRTMAVAAFMSTGLKSSSDKLSVSINGGGPIGNIIVAAKYGSKLRGYVTNPTLEPPRKENGKLDVGFAVGKQGSLTVIKDLGLKEPYVGNVPLQTGEIGEDFAYYYTVSEQQPSAVAVGVMMENGVALGAGGIIIQPLPNCPDHILTVLEDIAGKFTNISEILRDMEPRDIIDREFGHFEHAYAQPVYPVWECICSRGRMASIIKSLSAEEVHEILRLDDKIEIKCHFCNTKYAFTAEEIIKIRKSAPEKDE